MASEGGRSVSGVNVEAVADCNEIVLAAKFM
jgi:hypothetical protein